MSANPGLIKNYIAGAAVSPCRLVKIGAAAGYVIHNAAATTPTLGVTRENILAATGQRIDVIHDGIAYVEAGAVVALGAKLTSDATGRAVTAVGTNEGAGTALEAATAAGDLIRMDIRRGLV
ncbi:MAG: DUF2190 family protein [Betaproteobacteria bacterium]|nr:DUF2190 family protein [Betaproteobacteria bacterium]